MKTVYKAGKCIQCGDSTNIQLDCGKYACPSCLHRIGVQTKNVRQYLDDFSDVFNKEFMCTFIELLNVMKINEINSVDDIIKALSDIQYYKEYKNGTISVENKEKIEKQLDIL